MSPTRRKLTTIFCADVQDYSRLMGKTRRERLRLSSAAGMPWRA